MCAQKPNENTRLLGLIIIIGTSLEVFKKWCSNETNMCILPGYCVVGTVGNKILTQSNVVREILSILFSLLLTNV